MQWMGVAEHHSPHGLIGEVPPTLQIYRRRDVDHRHRRVAIQTAAATRITNPVISDATRR
jgi:hypothetical protein